MCGTCTRAWASAAAKARPASATTIPITNPVRRTEPSTHLLWSVSNRAGGRLLRRCGVANPSPKLRSEVRVSGFKRPRGGNVSRFITVLAGLLTGLACGATAVAASPPAVTTGGASAVTPQTATVRGSINPRGAPTAYYFRFGTTKSYGTRTSTGDAGAGTRVRAVSALLTGLRPNTTYHYALVGFSTAGSTAGRDRTFRTPQIPTTLALTASPNPVVYSGMVSIAGTLSGPDVGGKKVALESN